MPAHPLHYGFAMKRNHKTPSTVRSLTPATLGAVTGGGSDGIIGPIDLVLASASPRDPASLVDKSGIIGPVDLVADAKIVGPFD